MKRVLRGFDRRITTFVAGFPLWIRPFMLFATLVGQPPFTVGLVAGIIGFGLARSNSFLVIVGLIAIITIAISSLLKIVLRRARPDNDYVRSMLFQTFSFPSGHAAGSLVSYGLFAYLVWLMWPAYGMVTVIVVGILCLCIGLSRVYLGAHYPSDVLGGWIVGGIGLLLIVMEGSL